MRIILLLAGLFLLLIHHNFYTFTSENQFILFAVGILLLGIPHGAADLLVATRNAKNAKENFSVFAFLAKYLSRLVGFGLILYFFPLLGNITFMFLAAYHFGETDLHKFNTNTFYGKALVVSYGMVILSVILMPNFNEVKSILLLFEAGSKNIGFINWLDTHQKMVIFTSVGALLVSSVLYFYKLDRKVFLNNKYLVLQLSMLLIILYNTPMILGFTFYFVVWHSALSLLNIVTYLQKNNTLLRPKIVLKQILFYSSLAIAGILIFGMAGFMFVNNNAIMAYSFLGLAVLTAPHMQVMHDMYHSIRVGKGS